MKTYLAGPMRKRRYFNFPAFDDAKARAIHAGLHPVSPADLDRATGFDPWSLGEHWDWSKLPEGFDIRETIRRDIEALLECQAIAMLPGWEQSTGALAELAVARTTGLKVLDAKDFSVLDENVLDEAKRLTRGDRNADYGHPAVEHDRIACYWEVFLGVPVTGEQVAMMMVLLKVARLGHAYKRDSLVDIAGYADCCQRIVEARKATAKPVK